MDRGNKHLRYGLLAVAVLLGATGHAGHYEKKTPNNPSGGVLTYAPNWYVYSGNTNNYGASEEENAASMTCLGEITTEWIWVPDDAFDTPPAYVIVREACKVEYSAQYLLDDEIGNIQCDNDLGFPSEDVMLPWFLPMPGFPPPGMLVGWFRAGKSEGVRLTKYTDADMTTIEVTCDPSSEAVTELGLANASVIYSSEIIVPTVDLVGVTRFYTPVDALKFITGQQITADIDIAYYGPEPLWLSEGLELEPLVIDSNSYAWSFPSTSLGTDIDAFKNYTTGSVGKRWNLEATDYDNLDFKFYSNLAGTTKVACDIAFQPLENATFAGGLPAFHAESKEIKSERPTKAGWDVRTGTVQFIPNSSNPTKIQFAAGGISSDGQQWASVEFSVPGGFAQEGKGCFCQLVNGKRDLYRELNPFRPPGFYFTHYRNEYFNLNAVDTGFPYTIPPPPTTVAVWDLPALGSSVDSPFQPLTLSVPWTDYWRESRADDSFETWIMYMPPPKDGQPTVWIPIASYEWSWQGSATRSSNTASWVAGVFSGGVTAAVHTSETHPAWIRTVSGLNFIGTILP